MLTLGQFSSTAYLELKRGGCRCGNLKRTKELKRATMNKAAAASNALVYVGSAVAERHLDALNTRTVKIPPSKPNVAYIRGFMDAGEIPLRRHAEVH